MSPHLIEPELGRISGGAAFNRALAEAAGPRIMLHSAPGSWTEPGPAESAAVQSLMAAVSGPVLIDGLIATRLPEVVTDPAHEICSGQGPLIPLIHCLADPDDADFLDRERRVISAAPAVITTSRFTAAGLESRYGIRAEVAVPGNPARPQSSGSGGGHFVCIGAVEENKGQLLIAEALRELKAEEQPWRVTFAGPVADADYARRLQSACRGLPAGIADIVGELTAAEIDALYDHADLLLLPSRSEAYGLVVAEAAAAGIPAFVTAGTGAEEPLKAGLGLPRTVGAWTQALRRWLSDDELRDELAESARRNRSHAVRSWTDTAAEVLRVVAEHTRPAAPPASAEQQESTAAADIKQRSNS
ncbi:Glycosyl transferases group 1 [Brevibacterium siliguriense]|uniref:Glycosyl transferases group 1 n=1 Tax=Brevibacterium siliguriense TaxID=1136497 RepID=A0A1H1W3A0_9MICO|nr:glycosyltransferase family 4 protein [Brevibacterium siliguriense]SDS90689.1 Glycosyl transferases group 1 [Brevibacterium siliguriense]